jgi:glycosyltransferase involved in cell wall biosynthesis
VIADLAVAQRQAGHDVIVVSDSGSQSGYTSHPEYLDLLRNSGVELHAVRSTFARDLALNINAAGDVFRFIGSRQIDVAHAHAAIPAMIARLACGKRATPVLATMHRWGIRKTAEQARTDITLLGLADAVVTPSAAFCERLRGLGVQQNLLEAVPYGIASGSSEAIDDGDAPSVASIRSRGDQIAICVVREGERTNQRLLLQALAQAGCERLHAVFVGEGETGALEAEAAAIGVGARVHVLGYRSDTSRYVRQADVVVVPSHDEGLPVVVLEALRDGVPLVAADAPEILEALEDGRCGYVFTAGSVAGLTDALRRALSQHAGRPTLAATQRLHWEQHHRVEQMVAAYDALYASLVVARLLRVQTSERVAIGRSA